MPQTDRRHFIQAVATTTVISPLVGWHVAAAETSSRIRIGQIGTKHAHASGKMATMRKFSDDYEVVGVVEPGAPTIETTTMLFSPFSMSLEILRDTVAPQMASFIAKTSEGPS